MTSPYATKTRESWREELGWMVDDLAERNVDLSVRRTVSVEFAGTPEARLALSNQFAEDGWRSMRGIGAEPDATVIMEKTDAWSCKDLTEMQDRLIDAAQVHGAVFEGLCYHEENIL